VDIVHDIEQLIAGLNAKVLSLGAWGYQSTLLNNLPFQPEGQWGV